MEKILAVALAATLLSGMGVRATAQAQGPSMMMGGGQSSQPVVPNERLCNSQAGEQKLSGDARKAFMSKCLMPSCNARAAAQKLTGDPLKKFMSSCLSG